MADNIVKQADSLDRADTFEYDIMHRMTKSVNAEGGITTYGYDIRGNQNELNDALGYTWNYQYDLVDQLTASVDPEGKATEFFVKYFSLKKASEFPFFSKGFSLLSAGIMHPCA